MTPGLGSKQRADWTIAVGLDRRTSPGGSFGFSKTAGRSF